MGFTAVPAAIDLVDVSIRRKFTTPQLHFRADDAPSIGAERRNQPVNPTFSLVNRRTPPFLSVRFSRGLHVWVLARATRRCHLGNDIIWLGNESEKVTN
jgi:hypothetical protein